MSYKIVRMYQNYPGKTRTIKRGLSLQEARDYCQNPETSSRTAQLWTGRRVTARMGPWFDDYEEE